MKLAITICATSKYTYALATQANAVFNCIREYERINGSNAQVKVILVGSAGCKKLKAVEKHYNTYGIPSQVITINDSDNNKNYKTNAQLLIAKLRSLAFQAAKIWGATHCWSLDSDVIPKANTLNCLLDVLKFDGGYYQVTFGNYPSQGGGLFLGGFGSPTQHILKDIANEEKEVNPKISERIKYLEGEVKRFELELKEKPSQELYNSLMKVSKRVYLWGRYLEKKVPPSTMNVFALNAKQFRRRGWFDMTYPGIGKGSIVPVDWVGFGNTMMNEKALNLIDFAGYEGKGTEDLFIIWYRWYINNIRIAAIPHCPADHIIRKNTEEPTETEYVHVIAYHETEGECVGHLRQRQVPFKEYEL